MFTTRLSQNCGWMYSIASLRGHIFILSLNDSVNINVRHCNTRRLTSFMRYVE
jgi:hypothetical protein